MLKISMWDLPPHSGEEVMDMVIGIRIRITDRMLPCT
jgi:hypothetical protein